MTKSEIETVARAICVAHDQDPDGLDPAGIPWWVIRQREARTHIAAFRAIRKMELKDVRRAFEAMSEVTAQVASL
jgi:hypothetical protein